MDKTYWCDLHNWHNNNFELSCFIAITYGNHSLKSTKQNSVAIGNTNFVNADIKILQKNSRKYNVGFKLHFNDTGPNLIDTSPEFKKDNMYIRNRFMDNKTDIFVYDKYYQSSLSFKQMLKKIGLLYSISSNARYKTMHDNINDISKGCIRNNCIELNEKLSFIIKSFMQWKTTVLHHLMVRMIILFVLLQKKNLVSPSAINASCEIYPRSKQ